MGERTDDTSMALCLAESILEHDRPCPETEAQRSVLHRRAST